MHDLGFVWQNQGYLSTMQEFIQVPIWIARDIDEDDDILSIVNPNPELKRLALIPMELIGYMYDGIERKTTEIILKDGEVIIAAESFDVLTQVWAEWYNNKNKSFISFSLKNN
jgi:hypothetical protein